MLLQFRLSFKSVKPLHVVTRHSDIQPGSCSDWECNFCYPEFDLF